jgi:hypothetical protein
MPVPSPSRNNQEAQQNWVEFTISRPASLIADDEASLLYDIWKSAPPGSKVFAAPQGIDQRKVLALKAKGFIAGFGDRLELTERGRRIVVEMVTHEPNAFEVKQASMTYSEIKKNGCKRPIQSLIKKHAQAEKKDERPAFNLRRESSKRI